MIMASQSPRRFDTGQLGRGCGGQLYDAPGQLDDAAGPEAVGTGGQWTMTLFGISASSGSTRTMVSSSLAASTVICCSWGLAF